MLAGAPDRRLDRSRPPALVVSIDVELRWGLRDLIPPDGGPYRENLLGARRALPRLLDLFRAYDVGATWAMVGFLMAGSRDELMAHAPPPELRPAYADRRLDPYGEATGRDERDDPLHFGASLVARIADCPRQEIASHTFSHYYCLERGQTRASFAADLAAAARIAAARGVQLSSIALPRNQLNSAYAGALREAGIAAVRGNQRGWLYRPATDAVDRSLPRRAGRLVDAYTGVTGSHVLAWPDVPRADGTCEVAASMFLRPYSPLARHLEAVRIARIQRGVRAAAAAGGIFHLWWHLHNVGRHIDQNLGALRTVLDTFAACREGHGMQSLPMREVASAARS
jgi:peptidoglycan/xylan/chitin deacetylase (PgdA/CDA1 family)